MRRIAYLLLSLLLLLNIAGAPQTHASNKPKICPVHRVPLKREQLAIVYGLVASPCDGIDHAWAAVKHFPYANSVIYGGCVIYPDSPRYEEITYCPKCRAVEKTWPCLETHDTPIITTLPPRKVPRH